MAKQKGTLIAFSGLDGAGKSTQIEILIQRLYEAGQKPIYLWTRGGYTPRLEALKALWRRLLGRSAFPPGPNVERKKAFSRPWLRRLWLSAALLDLLWLYGAQVRWWRFRNCAVVCDRYLWDTLLDFRLNFGDEVVNRWWLWRILAWATPRPDAAFLLLVPVAESVRRSDLKGEPFRDTPYVLAERLRQYQAMAGIYKLHVLDGQKSVTELAAEILIGLNLSCFQTHGQSHTRLLSS